MPDFRGHLNMHDLSEGVYSGIGSPGSLHFDIPIKYLLRSLSDLAHHCARIFLLLPGAVTRTVVFKRDFESRHDGIANRVIKNSSNIMRATTDIDVAAPTERTHYIVLLFAPTIFLSAFLLFCSEPMVGKMMLPLLGGAASVWITCLLFFQLMLLAGYGYAHALERYANVHTQMMAHAGLMVAALIFLPMHFGTRPDAAASNHPVLWLLGQLISTVGIPFGVVSTTAPLLQNWLSKTRTASGKDPYFLYAVSKAGS